MTNRNSIIGFTLAVLIAAAPARAQLSVKAPAATQGASGQNVTIAISLTNGSSTPIDAFGFDLDFPTNLLQYQSTSKTGTLTGGWIVVNGVEITPGKVRIGGFHTTPLTTSGVVLNVVFKLNANVLGTGNLTLSQFLDDFAGATTAAATIESVVPPGVPGLLGEYYDNRDFSGALIRRIDPVVDFSWYTGSPDPSMGSEHFSVRWSGFIVPDYTETYTIHTVTDDGVRLWLNNVLVIDQWIDQDPTEWTANIAMTSGVPVAIKMEYYERNYEATARLLWSALSVEKQTISYSNLLAAPCGNGRGDINGDGLLATTDATCAFDIYINNQLLPPSCNFQNYVCELISADVNCSGSVTPGDALAIDQRATLGLLPLDCFAETPSPPLPPFQLALAQTVVPGGSGSQLRVTVQISNPQGVDAFGARLAYPASELTFDRAEKAYLIQGWLRFGGGGAGSGQMVLGGFNPAAIASSAPAELVHVYFDFVGAPGTVSGLALNTLVDDFTGASIVGTITGTDTRPIVLATVRLHQNYPNPFNPTTSIRYDVSGSAARVRLAIYTVRGELVRTLIDDVHTPGVHTALWDGTNADGHAVPSGIYFYSLHAGQVSRSRRMVLLK